MSLKITSLNFVTAYLAANNKKLQNKALHFKLEIIKLGHIYIDILLGHYETSKELQ